MASKGSITDLTDPRIVCALLCFPRLCVAVESWLWSLHLDKKGHPLAPSRSLETAATPLLSMEDMRGKQRTSLKKFQGLSPFSDPFFVTSEAYLGTRLEIFKVVRAV